MPESGDKFTILTSAYNSSKFMQSWAKSILVQKHRPLEVIFVNDCSKDDTLSRVYETKGSYRMVFESEQDGNFEITIREK